ncbi:hypothetical protein [Aequorivita marisscotiae]|uniref:Uncharacterized protein n=1 Tax=Aequorivita marisscotiae TaxID=3040348 RepID=A0ABY8KTY1_9FLAO|nr:hypothetical protein [Aequorivita sp. Ant34-E75]WGF92492.1 hypothetical protein QCQ61_14960 [Aequorivita sp. Ant34-E75]
MNNKSTKEKSAPQATETVMGFQTTWSNKINFYLIFLCIVAVLSPFLHVLYLTGDTEGIFGFAYMSSFMFSISLPLMAISSGLILKFTKTIVIDEFKVIFGYIANTFLLVGFFFLIYTFAPMYDLSIYAYYVVLLILSLALTFIASKIHKAIITTEQRLKRIISKLFDFIILETPRKHVSEEKQIDYVISYEKIINEIGEE